MTPARRAASFSINALMLAGAFWYGTSRSMPRGTVYVPAQLEGDRIEPGHAEPRR